jgi:hypothetical protein
MADGGSDNLPQAAGKSAGSVMPLSSHGTTRPGELPPELRPPLFSKLSEQLEIFDPYL